MRYLACAVLAACAATPPRPTRPATLVPDCFLGPDHCTLSADLDGDTRPDTIEAVHDLTCGPSDDDRPCLQGFWITLAAGPTQLVGAGTPLAADTTATEDQEPISLEPDLGFLTFLSITHRRPDGGANWRQVVAAPCAADAIRLSGGDAAFILCWSAGSARAYHLGF